MYSWAWKSFLGSYGYRLPEQVCARLQFPVRCRSAAQPVVEQDAKPVWASVSFWRPATGEQHRGARRAGIVGCLFLDTCLWTSKKSMPGGEQRYFDGQLNDDYSSEVLVYRKSPFFRSLNGTSLHDDFHGFSFFKSNIVLVADGDWR